MPDAARHRFGGGKKVRNQNEICQKGYQALVALDTAQKTTTDNYSSFSQSLAQFDQYFRLTPNTGRHIQCITDNDIHPLHYSAADEYGCHHKMECKWMEAKERNGLSEYSNAISHDGKYLVALNNEGKHANAMHWDRVVAACLARQNPPKQISNVRMVIQKDIINDEWEAAVSWLYKHRNVEAPETWLTVRKSDVQEYYMMIGTPNGVGTIHLLIDHMKYKPVGTGYWGFGRRASVDKIRVNMQIRRMEMRINVPSS